MNYVVAVSGGVDSVALLHMMVQEGSHTLIVAHFDHGIRSDSAEDAQFVESLAKKYGLEYESSREELGVSAGEALARQRRYAFLHSIAQKHAARIITAHHLDDLVETVAINMTRGTGWRGLAVFESSVVRPLIDTSKSLLIRYAAAHNLEWREDSTNASDAYLRNRIRAKASLLDEGHKREIRALHAHQKVLRKDIEAEVVHLIGNGPRYDRHTFIQLPRVVALECLRVITRGELTRPQLGRLLNAVKTAQPGSKYEAKSQLVIHFTTRYFTL